MAKILLKAKFRGADGSMGFKKGLNYNLSLEHWIDGSGEQELQISTTTKPSLFCTYSSIFTFFDNWTDIKPR